MNDLKISVFEKIVEDLKNEPSLSDKNDQQIMNKIVQFVNNAQNKELYKINVNELQNRFDFPASEILRVMLYFSAKKAFNISYDIQCPECKLITSEYNSLSEIRLETHCPQCGIDLDVDFGKSALVTFNINDDILHLDVDEMFAEKNCELVASKLDGSNIAYPTLLQILSLWDFYVLFPDNSIPASAAFPIDNITILSCRLDKFDSIARSLGDNDALNFLNKIQRTVFETIKTNFGKVIKIFGNYILTVFHNPADAVKAAFSIRSNLMKKNENSNIAPCIGINKGSCLCYSVNQGIEYFGQTVELAQHLSNISDGKNFIISEALRNDNSSISIISEHTNKLKYAEVKIDGYKNKINVYLVDF